jgi:deoxyribonuclease-4
MSIAGGYYKAVEQAARCACDCVQLFTKNNNQWRAKDLSEEDVSAFRAKLSELQIAHPIAHDSYLINLATPDDALWKKSIDAFVVELQRAERLGLAFVVIPARTPQRAKRKGCGAWSPHSMRCIGRRAS